MASTDCIVASATTPVHAARSPSSHTPVEPRAPPSSFSVDEIEGIRMRRICAPPIGPSSAL